MTTELARGDSGLADKLVQNWKISVLIAQLAPEHLQEYWFTRYMNELSPPFLTYCKFAQATTSTQVVR